MGQSLTGHHIFLYEDDQESLSPPGSNTKSVAGECSNYYVLSISGFCYVLIYIFRLKEFCPTESSSRN